MVELKFLTAEPIAVKLDPIWLCSDFLPKITIDFYRFYYWRLHDALMLEICLDLAENYVLFALLLRIEGSADHSWALSTIAVFWLSNTDYD